MIYTLPKLEDDQKFNLTFYSQEDDGGFRFGDDIGSVEKSFGINDKGIHNIALQDDGDNEVEFRIRVETWPEIVITLPKIPDTVPSLRGIRVYEDWKYNVGSGFIPALVQNFDAGDYDLPYEPEFSMGGRFPFPVRVIGVQPDSISSLKIGNGYYVELYDQLGQKGTMIKVSENTPIMPDGWNDRVKSIGVRKIESPIVN
jgi:hypothetical protein